MSVPNYCIFGIWGGNKFTPIGWKVYTVDIIGLGKGLLETPTIGLKDEKAP
jgi:hypothetical protein